MKFTVIQLDSKPLAPVLTFKWIIIWLQKRKALGILISIVDACDSWIIVCTPY
jgi:hypothetical protein